MGAGADAVNGVASLLRTGCRQGPVERRGPDAALSRTKGLALPFGSFMFYGASLPAYDYSRTPKRIRQDSLDHWIVAICRRGAQRQRSGDEVTDLQAGVPYVFSMARPFEAVREGPQIDWQSIFIARDAVPELDPPSPRHSAGPSTHRWGGCCQDTLRLCTPRWPG